MSFLSLSPTQDCDSGLSSALVYISKTKFEEDWPSLPHLHHFIELIFIVSGSGHFVVNEKFYPIQKGSLIIVDQSLMHTEVSDKKDALSYYTIGLKDMNYQGLNKNKFIFDTNFSIKEYAFCFESIFKEMQKKNKGYATIVKNLLSNLMVLTARTTYLTPIKDDTKNTVDNLKDAIEYMDTNYTREINLDELCSLVFMSKSYFIYKFKETTGLTPISYLIDKRIEASKTLLLTTTLSVNEIAIIINFPSTSSFIAKFKQSTGMTPLKYRLKNL